MCASSEHQNRKLLLLIAKKAFVVGSRGVHLLLTYWLLLFFVVPPVSWLFLRNCFSSAAEVLMQLCIDLFWCLTHLITSSFTEKWKKEHGHVDVKVTLCWDCFSGAEFLFIFS